MTRFLEWGNGYFEEIIREHLTPKENLLKKGYEYQFRLPGEKSYELLFKIQSGIKKRDAVDWFTNWTTVWVYQTFFDQLEYGSTVLKKKFALDFI